MNTDKTEKGFTITDHHGFHLQFANGLYISVQWGPGNYCDHHGEMGYYRPRREDSWTSSTAEIAVVDMASGMWMTRKVGKRYRLYFNDDVVGRVTPDEIVKWIVATSRYPKKGA